MNRIKSLLKKHNFQLSELSKKMGLQYPSFYRMMNKPTLKFLNALSKATNITVIEFQDAPEGYAHFYDDITNEWIGIRKK